MPARSVALAVNKFNLRDAIVAPQAEKRLEASEQARRDLNLDVRRAQADLSKVLMQRVRGKDWGKGRQGTGRDREGDKARQGGGEGGEVLR